MTAPAVLFTSDLHIRGDDDPVAGLFRRFLDETAARAEKKEVSALYILGDLFEYWVERGGRSPAVYAGTVAALSSAAKRGLVVKLLPGNRDFLAGRALSLAAGLEVLGDRAEIAVGGKRVLLTHGDLLCARDRRYLLWRRIARGPALRLLARVLPLALSERIAAGLKKASTADCARKSPEVFAITEEDLKREFARGIDAIICGHTHRAERRPVEMPSAAEGGEPRKCELIVLGRWGPPEGGEKPVGSCVESDGERLEIKSFP